jgi:hypothetical protein
MYNMSLNMHTFIAVVQTAPSFLVWFSLLFRVDFFLFSCLMWTPIFCEIWSSQYSVYYVLKALYHQIVQMASLICLLREKGYAPKFLLNQTRGWF